VIVIAARVKACFGDSTDKVRIQRRRLFEDREENELCEILHLKAVEDILGYTRGRA
jgi:hypothetical protein